MNCPKEVSNYAIQLISKKYETNFSKSYNLFSSISSSSEIVELSGHLKNLAVFLLKFSSDLILLSSGPITGLNEITLPANEAGSSIMPGKINPTQCEALQMVACQVLGNDYAINLGEMHGKLQLNTFRPLMIRNILQSVEILNDSIESFTRYCLIGIKANKDTLERNTKDSKMIVTALVPYIGYEKVKDLVSSSLKNKTNLKEEILAKKLFSEEELAKIFNSSTLISPPTLYKSHAF
jgi:fumarate hydratase class II